MKERKKEIRDLGAVRLKVVLETEKDKEHSFKHQHILQVYVELGHCQYLNLSKTEIPESIWQEIWRRTLEKEA